MTAPTKAELLEALGENFRLAAEHCALLAVLPIRGPTYAKLREELRRIEGLCRAIGMLENDDARWLRLGLMMAEAHRRAGDWLRRFYPRPLFLKLAENLHAAETMARGLAERPANVVNIGHSYRRENGLIVPAPRQPPHRDTRPVQVLIAAGG